MIKWQGQPDIVNTITEYLNYFFAGIFTIEAIVKIIAFGKIYFKDKWNLFDLIVVSVTIATIIL